MPQMNYMNLADTYGRGQNDADVGAMNALKMDAAKQQIGQIGDEQKHANAVWLKGASEYVMQNPQAAPQFVAEGISKGLFKEGTTAEGLTPEVLQRINKGAIIGMGGTPPKEYGAPVKGMVNGQPELVRPDNLGGMNPTGIAPVPAAETTDIQNWKYGQDNPGFQEASVAAAPDGRTAQEKNYDRYNALKTPEEKKQFMLMLRGERGPSSTLENRLFDVHDEAFESRANADRYTKLADDLVRTDPDSGKTAEWTEQIKTLTGSEDAVTLLRKQWNELRVGAAVKNLPPGVASDKDIELVMSAFLPEFANPETVASFMRGLAKLETFKAEYKEFEADYLSERGSGVGMSGAWKEKMVNIANKAPQQADPYQQARDAIADGISRSAVIQELTNMGLDPSKL